MIYLLLLIFLFPVSAHADQTAASCSAADINAAIAAAVDGETVNIPACAETTITSQILIPNTKGIALVGAGEGVTNLKDGTTGVNEPIRINFAPQNSMSRLAHFTFNANLNNNSGSNYTALAAVGTGLDKFRIDHITLTNVKIRGVKVFTVAPGTAEFSGLIDHVTCNMTGASQCFNVNGSGSGGFLYDQQPGTNHLTYIEAVSYTHLTLPTNREV